MNLVVVESAHIQQQRVVGRKSKIDLLKIYLLAPHENLE